MDRRVGLALMVMIAAGAARADTSFEFRRDWVEVQPATVTLAGSFNAWSIDANPMPAAGGGFRTSVPLADGDHEYKFHVVDVAGNEYWLNDRANTFYAPDGKSGVNNLLTISAGQRVDPSEGIQLFQFDAADAGYVNLAGDFNNWTQGTVDLRKGDDGLWRCGLKVPLPISYQFIVDGMWKIDPAPGTLLVPSDYGAMNSMRIAPEQDALDWEQGANSVAKAGRAPAAGALLTQARQASKEGNYQRALGLVKQSAAEARVAAGQGTAAARAKAQAEERAALMEEVTTHRRFGHRARAVPALERVRALHPNSDEARHARWLLGKHYLYGGKDPAMARTVFSEVLQSDPTPAASASALFNIGLAYYEEGRLDEAVATLRQATAAAPAPDPNNRDWDHELAEIQLYLGITEFRAGLDPELAKGRFREVLRLSPWKDSQSAQIATMWMKHIDEVSGKKTKP